jgi:hypothetical protein
MLAACAGYHIWSTVASAGVGDPQVRTNHPWYPGELACSTFERLFDTQAEMFERATGRAPQSDEDRALAAWMWRNLHFAHGEEGAQDLWGTGYRSGDTTTREYWTGLFAHGFGLCGTTHAQWTAELNALLGPSRSRTVGVAGHNACEVFLTGGPYQDGRWALLDHDLSTVIFDPTGARLLSIDEIRQNLAQLIDPQFEPERQHGWPLGGLHPDDPRAYSEFNTVEHLPGYAGPPPMIHLRRGETLRRYYEPGLDDGRTFVFWGRNYRTDNIPGPERSRTWINQPERFVGSPGGSGYRPGQARYGNAVYTYRPNFKDGSYREGIVAESGDVVIFEFQTPYIIAATPPNDSDWGIYEPGGRNGLVINGRDNIPVSVSTDRGTTWHEGGSLKNAADLTDFVKGHRGYWLKLHASPERLALSDLEITTVCQANPATFPRLTDDGSTVSYAASATALSSIGPEKPHAASAIVDGAFDTPYVVLELPASQSGTPHDLYAAAHVASSNPPDPAIRYDIDWSADGAEWQPVVEDWHIIRRDGEPADFWSQSFCYGDVALPSSARGPIRVRFRNDGGKRILRAETHLAYSIPRQDSCQATFCWSDSSDARRTASHTFAQSNPEPWRIDTGNEVRMHWVEFTPVP